MHLHCLSNFRRVPVVKTFMMNATSTETTDNLKQISSHLTKKLNEEI